MRRCLLFALPLTFVMILGPLTVRAQFGLPLQTRTWDKQPLVPPVDWVVANQKLSGELRTAAIGDLAQRALRDPMPETAAGWLRRLTLLVRAEYRQDALDMLKSRPRFLGTRWNWNINHLAAQSTRTYRFPELARSICERFPEEFYDDSTIGDVLRTLPPATVDAWLARQGMKGYERWFYARLRLRRNLGTQQELLAPLERRVRTHPADLEAIGEYLQALQETLKTEDRTWLSAVCKPRLAVQSLMVGYYFACIGIDAIPLYERSLQTPFRHQDVAWYADFYEHSGSAQARRHFALTEKQLRLWTKAELMEAYKRSGQAARAQALLEELTAQNPDGLPDLFQAFGAGQTQAASGARVIEARIQAAENKPENRESPDYWLERADYYAGRKEDGPAVEAFERALRLSPISDDKVPSRRYDVVDAYQRYLWHRGNIPNPAEAVAFLWHEIAMAPPESNYAASLLNLIDNYDTDTVHFINPDDPQLWKLLAAQTDWTGLRSLLHHLRNNTPPAEQDGVWMRLEELARQGGVTRAYILGERELYGDAAGRAIPVLTQALPRTQDKQQQWDLLTTLWKAQSRMHDWRGMQATLSRLTAVGVPGFDWSEYWREMAEAAAQSGAMQEASGFFREWANKTFDRVDDWRELAMVAARCVTPQDMMGFFRVWANQDRRPIPTFAYNGYGVAEELKTYLQQIKVAEPCCATPALCDFKPRRGNGPQGPSGPLR